ncbi:methyltransferase [Planctomycetales bacterium]|nr:methyltransferase [Planctomycetales bacterium]
MPPPPPRDLRCLLCDSRDFRKREGKVRDNPTLEIFECEHCGLVCLSSTAHIDETFYEASGMHPDGAQNDLDRWLKNSATDDDRRYATYAELCKNKDILDFGCGAGGFLIRARQAAHRVYGIELERRLRPHFAQNNLTVFHDLDELSESVDLIFLFHCLEHLKDPFAILAQMKQKLKPNGKIIVEVPNADDVLLTLYRSSAFAEFTYWSAHLYLYNAATLNLLAKKSGLQVIAVKQEQRYPLSNHLYWLARGKPGGHSQWAFLDGAALNDAYAAALAAVGKCDTVVAYLGVE